MPGIPFEGGRNVNQVGGKPYVPPSGFAGASQQTQASQAATFAPASIAGFRRGVAQAPRRRRKKRKAAAKTHRRARRAPSKRGKLKRMVKGSKAARAYMAKIRRMRR